MGNIEERLVTLKKEIETAKSSKDQLGGERIQLMAQLKEKFGASTIEEAEKKLEKLQEEGPKLELLLTEKSEALEANYNWD